MVTIIDYRVRQSRDGEPFIALIVQGGIELVKSKETGMFYATAKKASIPSTFDERTAQAFIGQQIDGTVQKAGCEPYEIVDTDTGEVRILDFRWVYVKEGETLGQTVRQYEEALV